MYGGKVESTNELAGDAIVTIWSAEWPQAESTGDMSIKAFDVDISEVDLLVSISCGIEEEENLD